MPKREFEAARDALLARAKEAGLEARLDDIAPLIQPSIQLVTKKKVPKGHGVAISRIGGAPDLPPKTKWPRSSGFDLAFLLQVRLDEVAPHDVAGLLPKTGLLSFFLAANPDADDYGSGVSVMHFPEPSFSTLVPTPGSKQAREDGPQSARAIEFVTVASLPPPEGHAIAPLKLGDLADRYWDGLWMEHLGEGSPCHRLLGWPHMNYHHHQKKSDQLLLELEPDDDAEWDYGDSQPVRVYVPKKALAAGDFGKAWGFGDEE